MSEDSNAKKLKATARVHALADFMYKDDGLGYWKEKGHAGLFLASYAAMAGLPPVQLSVKANPEHKLFDFVNYYSLQKSINDIGELACVHLAAGTTDSVDHTLISIVPGLMEAGADALEAKLRSPDALGALLLELRKFS